jgi:hypothetical protein
MAVAKKKMDLGRHVTESLLEYTDRIYDQHINHLLECPSCGMGAEWCELGKLAMDLMSRIKNGER